MKKSEQRQQDILAFMKKTIAAKGYSPTVREICQALNIKSTSTVHSDIKSLENKGLVCKDPSKPRTVLPVDMKPGTVAQSDDISTVSLPVIGRVAAGEPILAEQNIVDEMPMPARFIGPGNNFILTVHGDSMVNVGINDGDYIIVQESQEANNGEIVVALVNDLTMNRLLNNQILIKFLCRFSLLLRLLPFICIHESFCLMNVFIIAIQ